MIDQIKRVQRRVPLLQLAALLLCFLWGATTIDGFTQRTTIYSMLVLAALLGIAALGQTIVILIGNLDLSVGPVISAGAIALVQLAGVKQWPFVAAFAVVIAIGLTVGAFNGYICHRFRVQSIVVTLATGAIVSGALLVVTSGNVTGTAPEWLSRLTSPASHTFGIAVPPLVVIWAGLAILTAVFLGYTRAGRAVYHVGSNPVAADLALVPSRRVWIGAFAASGVCAVLTGVLLAGFASSANQNTGDPYLFQALAAVFVGGTAMIGARGDYWRTVVGALLLTVLTTVLVGKGYAQADQQIVFGVLIVAVVVLYAREASVRDRV